MDHSIMQAIEDPELGIIELGYMVGKHPINARTFAVYIPKLMPMIGLGGSKTSAKKNIDRSIFINSEDTKPSISLSISTKNYINLTLYPNRSTSSSSNRDVELSTIGPGNQMVIHFFDHSILNGRLDEVL